MTKNEIIKLLEGQDDAIASFKAAVYDVGEDEDRIILRKIDDEYHVYKYSGVFFASDEIGDER